MALGLRCQARVGVPSVGDAGGDGDQVGDAGADDRGDPVVDLLAGLVVTPAETVADASERFLGPGQGAVAGVGDGGGFFGGPDVGDAQPVGAAGVVVEDLSVAQHALPQGALIGGQPSFALGAVVECGQRVDAAVDVGGEPLGPAGVGAQRHHEPQPGGIGGAQPAQVAEPGVGDTDDPGRGQLADAVQRGGQAGRLVGCARMPAVVDRDPGAGRCLQGLDLPGNGAVGGPPLGDQRRALVAPGEPDRGHVQVQPGQVGPAA